MKRRRSTELDDLVGRVAQWRQEHGGRGSRIPEGLWKAAVRVTRVVGVWATAKALRFNYEALKRRARQDGAAGGIRGAVAIEEGAAVRTGSRAAAKQTRRIEAPSIGSPDARFIALEMGQFGGAGRTVIDLLGRSGDRMRVEVAGCVDLAGLVQTFWSRQS